MGILGDILGFVDNTISDITDNLHFTNYGAKHNAKVILHKYQMGEITKQEALELIERYVKYY